MTVSPKPLVISASRRTDMVAGDPDNLVLRLKENAPPEQTHSLVIWTKNPGNMLYHKALSSCLQAYDQLFLLYSITGLGATLLEPGVPSPEKAIALLPELIKLVKRPDRIRVRFDPIVHFDLPDGSRVCNLEFFSTLAPQISQLGIKHVITSWVQIYPKVAKRLTKPGISIHTPDAQQLKAEAEYLESIAAQNDLTLHGCSVPGWPVSRCIDGHLLNRLHPKGHVTTTRKAGGQRQLCGCTHSKDIGWYHQCPNGCIYCYGNPKITAI